MQCQMHELTHHYLLEANVPCKSAQSFSFGIHFGIFNNLHSFSTVETFSPLWNWISFGKYSSCVQFAIPHLPYNGILGQNMRAKKQNVEAYVTWSTDCLPRGVWISVPEGTCHLIPCIVKDSGSFTPRHFSAMFQFTPNFVFRSKLKNHVTTMNSTNFLTIKRVIISRNFRVLLAFQLFT